MGHRRLSRLLPHLPVEGLAEQVGGAGVGGQVVPVLVAVLAAGVLYAFTVGVTTDKERVAGWRGTLSSQAKGP